MQMIQMIQMMRIPPQKTCMRAKYAISGYLRVNEVTHALHPVPQRGSIQLMTSVTGPIYGQVVIILP